MTEEQPLQTTTEAGPACRRPIRRLWLVGGLAALVVLAALALLADRALPGQWLQLLPGRPKEALLGVVNVFSCCILSWRALTTMLPTFLLGGAITAFAPTGLILRYLGARSNQPRAYATAALSGMVLSLCSCSIVPLFASIYRRGAGTGPAFTLLFAGPAIHLISAVFTFQVIGWRLGMWRLILTPIIGVLVGLTMALLYRREQAAAVTAQQAQLHADVHVPRRLWALLGLLLLTVTYGAWEMPWLPKIIGVAICALLLALLTWRYFEPEERQEWFHETWCLVKLVVPVLLPAILVIGIIATYIDVKLVYHWVGSTPASAGMLGMVRPILTAEIFGELMYFPILSEVAFVKAFLKLGMAVGPALALLISGPGTSLPGAIIVARAVGWRKALAFEALVITFTTIFALIFTGQIGEYICSCMMGGH
jgi:uncharacterized protein